MSPAAAGGGPTRAPCDPGGPFQNHYIIMSKFNTGDHVAHVPSRDVRNHFVIKAVLNPGERLDSKGQDFPRWGLCDYVNESRETQYVCPDPMCGITFVFRESELKLIS